MAFGNGPDRGHEVPIRLDCGGLYLGYTCAAWAVSSGVNLIEVRDLLGHSTVKMTERYAHLAPENARKVTTALEGRSQSGHSESNVIDSSDRDRAVSS